MLDRDTSIYGTFFVGDQMLSPFKNCLHLVKVIFFTLEVIGAVLVSGCRYGQTAEAQTGCSGLPVERGARESHVWWLEGGGGRSPPTACECNPAANLVVGIAFT